MIISGGAPLSQQVFEFLKKAFGCPIFECMGATEAAGNLTTTAAWETQAGIQGGPLPCLKMKLVDHPEIGYLSSDTQPKGEIWVKGHCVFKGYFKNPELTKENLTPDGWLRTGDIGMLLQNGAIKVIDRIKNICKT